jgi:hypothetical protein
MTTMFGFSAASADAAKSISATQRRRGAKTVEVFIQKSIWVAD